MCSTEHQTQPSIPFLMQSGGKIHMSHPGSILGLGDFSHSSIVVLLHLLIDCPLRTHPLLVWLQPHLLLADCPLKPHLLLVWLQLQLPKEELTGEHPGQPYLQGYCHPRAQELEALCPLWEQCGDHYYCSDQSHNYCFHSLYVGFFALHMRCHQSERQTHLNRSYHPLKHPGLGPGIRCSVAMTVERAYSYARSFPYWHLQIVVPHTQAYWRPAFQWSCMTLSPFYQTAYAFQLNPPAWPKQGLQSRELSPAHGCHNAFWLRLQPSLWSHGPPCMSCSEVSADPLYTPIGNELHIQVCEDQAAHQQWSLADVQTRENWDWNQYNCDGWSCRYEPVEAQTASNSASAPLKSWAWRLMSGFYSAQCINFPTHDKA